MTLDIESMLEKITEMTGFTEDEVYFEKKRQKQKIKMRRLEKCHDIIQKISVREFRKQLIRISEKHDDRWCKLCYDRGYEPYPWHLIYILFDLAEQKETLYKGKPLDSFDAHFGICTFRYRNHYFNSVHGQGAVLRILDRNKKEIFHL